MNQKDLIRETVAVLNAENEENYTQKGIRKIMDAMQEVVFKALAEEDSVKIFDGLTFVGFTRPARTYKDPRTGEEIDAPERKSIRLKVGTHAKEAVNG